MPEEDENQIREAERAEPAYSGEDIPGEELRVPNDVPQEHLAHSSMMAGGVEKAPKNLIMKRLTFVLLFLVALGIVGFAAWKLIPAKGESNKSAQNTQSQSQQAQTSDPVATALGDTHLTQTYTSDTLRLLIKYPSSWKVTEENNAVTVKSPSFDLADNTGMEDSTYFKVYIKMGATETEGKYLGKGYAIAPSEKLAYTDPLVGQRKTTFLTDFGLDNPDNFAYLVVQGNFELEKGDTLGPKFASEPDAFLVTGGFATETEKDGLQTRLMSMDSYKQNLAYQTGVEIIKSLQLK